MAIRYITFECVSRCDMNCGFCFSYWREGAPEVKTDKAKEIIQQLKDQGLEAINFTGGEPLLREDLPELLRFCKTLGLTTIITTDSIPLKRRIVEIADNVDFIGLPIDSTDSTVHNRIRITKTVPNHHKHVLEMLNMLHKSYPHIGVKINTMVSQQNKDSIAGIGKLVEGKAISWKLSQFLPAAYGALHKTEFEISDEDYQIVVKKAQETKTTTPIVVAPANACDDCCRILSPNGELLQPEGNKLVSMGKVSTLSESEILRGFSEKENVEVLTKTYLKPKSKDFSEFGL